MWAGGWMWAVGVGAGVVGGWVGGQVGERDSAPGLRLLLRAQRRWIRGRGRAPQRGPAKDLPAEEGAPIPGGWGPHEQLMPGGRKLRKLRDPLGLQDWTRLEPS